ncbi:hypothetical protein, partial [Leucobacter sp. M11]|uniref:hypothetical protein n=1 Tax=Leucobacter sp. M11 TaxID=2993565 RepID=UPI002D804EF2
MSTPSRAVFRPPRAAVIGAVLALITLSLVPVATANADVPEAPVAAFNAACAGATSADPTTSSDVLGDLTHVDGGRLAQFNAGHPVPLYDANGYNDDDSFPPLCVVRASVDSPTGYIAEWLFCTDLASAVCGTTTREGTLEDGHGNPVGPMEPVGVNEKLSPDQERLIAYLIQNGAPFQSTGSLPYASNNSATRADSGTTSANRVALQQLVWCVSEADELSRLNGLTELCAVNLPAAEQARLLELIPDEPTVELSFTQPSEPLRVGQQARVVLRTNVFQQPISLAGNGLSGVSVCAGDATIVDASLVVTGSDPNQPKEVELCFTSTSVGEMALSAAAVTTHVAHIRWNQSASLPGNKPCQHFASFDATKDSTVSAQTRVLF